MPWAVLLAILILGAVEVVLRSTDPTVLIPYERGPHAARAPRLAVQALGNREVAIVGSSRAQIGLLSPLLEERLTDRAGRGLRVSNHAFGGARILQVEPLVRFLIDQEPPPRLLVYGLTIEQCSFEFQYTERSAFYWSLGDWLRVRKERGAAVDWLLPDVLRSEVSDRLLLLRYRERPTVALRDLMRPARGTIPMLGGLVAEHVDSELQRKQMDTSGDRGARVRAHLEAEHLRNGVYPLNEEKVQVLQELLEACRRRGVEVALVEMPNARVFRDNLPPGTVDNFNDTIRRIANSDGVSFLTLQDLGLEFEDHEFSDPVHLNTAGATRFTEALAAALPLPTR